MNCELLSKHRNMLMGVSMIFVILFHVGGYNHTTLWFCLSRCGNVGVDMFMFISGIGLWFAWTKSGATAAQTDGRQTPADGALASGWHHLATFYMRRYIRVYPAWFAVATIYYLILYNNGTKTLGDALINIAINWDFWAHDDGIFWFIPAIMMLYMVAPAYMTLIIRRPEWRIMPVAAILLCFLVQYWTPLHDNVGHLEIFFSRIPIFLTGINAGRYVKERQTLGRHALGPVLLLFGMSLAVSVNFEDGLRGHFPLFIERMAYIPLAVTTLLLLAYMADRLPQWCMRPMIFIGGISLEIYLIHANFVLHEVKNWHAGYWITAIATIGITTPLAWLLHTAIARITAFVTGILRKRI